MLFRQLFDRQTCTYTYILACKRTREAVMIDPVRELLDRDESFLRELSLDLKYVFETHVHADHVTAAAQLRARHGAKVVLSKPTGVDAADLLVDDDEVVRFGDQVLGVRLTPGHTNGCATFVTRDGMMAFTGDTLFVRGCGRTDFQQGSARRLYRSVHDKIFSLDDDCWIYPAHDYKGRTASTVREERLYNPRLGGGRTEDTFVEIMDALQLSPPARIHVAVPANLKLGLLPDEPVIAGEAGMVQEVWAPIRRSATGAPDVDTRWVAENRKEVFVLDVRQPDEFVGPLGHVPGSELLPINLLEPTVLSWPRTRPTVVVCRSGGRSERAALQMERLGFSAVASMSGGMTRWNELGLGVER